MPREVWGTFSVADHLREQAFVADILLYDRLVILVPPDHWYTHGFAVSSRQYDGTTNATITSDGTVSGSISGDSVSLNASGRSASFANTAAGTGKSVQGAGYALSGTDAADYTIAQPTTTADMGLGSAS